MAGSNANSEKPSEHGKQSKDQAPKQDETSAYADLAEHRPKIVSGRHSSKEHLKRSK